MGGAEIIRPRSAYNHYGDEMKKRKVWTYIISIAAAFAAAALGFLASNRGMPAYDALTKPPLTPPDAVFPTVWTVLFALMGIGAARVWLARGRDITSAITLYTVRLAMNVMWSILFFGAGLLLFSFIWLLGLLAVIAAMMAAFAAVDRTAALLQTPYLLWVTFAAYLNLMIWVLNR